MRSDEEEGPVLLVCIYNQFGNVITHDYLYQLFCPHGGIVKILIFEKAKVWKAFVQYQRGSQAEKALVQLNNKVIFEDGSKMNIFRSKLKHVQFHNDNLGGVNYQHLQQQQQQEEEGSNRRRTATFQDYIQPILQEPTILSFQEPSSHHDAFSSNSAKYKSETFSPKRTKQNSSINNLMDIDEQFREIAMESEQFRQWEECAEINRRKSKTIVNPNSEQFLQENCPSRVLFVRSLPEEYDHDCLYNIFSNFGKVSKVIFIRDKNSALVEFQAQISAIQAKDQINYAKPCFKVFYSHYDTLVLKKLSQDQQQHDYKSEGPARVNPNPPSQTLYMTMLYPKQDPQVRELCRQLGCPVKQMQWKQNSKQKWMCLIEFQSLEASLYVMGRLQGKVLSNGRRMRLSFTRSRIGKQSPYKYFDPLS